MSTVEVPKSQTEVLFRTLLDELRHASHPEAVKLVNPCDCWDNIMATRAKFFSYARYWRPDDTLTFLDAMTVALRVVDEQHPGWTFPDDS